MGYSEGDSSETNPVRKASGLKYNPSTRILDVEGGIRSGPVDISGDLQVTNGVIIGNVQGDITGVATPKIHLSDIPEYGGASTELYGHVKVQDAFDGVPSPSSNNTDKSAADIVNGIAASPYLV